LVDAATINAVKELAQTLGPWMTGGLVVGYVLKCLIDTGFELTVKVSKKR
jgi:hypothetical protein